MSEDKEFVPPSISDVSDDTRPLEPTPLLDAARVREARKPPAPPPPAKGERRYPFGYWLLWVVAVGSLVLNAVTLRELLTLRQFAGQAILETLAVVERLQQQTVTYTFHVDQTVVVDTDLPFNQTIKIPIKEEVPVSTTAVATIADLPFIGTINATVPVSATVPIDEEFEVMINETFHVTAPVSVVFDVPVAIAVSDTELYDTLEFMKQRLLTLSEMLTGRAAPGATATFEATDEPTAEAEDDEQ